MESVTQIKAFLQNVLQVGAREDGKATGFIQRVREFDGASFAQMMILGQMQEQDVSLSGLAHFARHARVKVTESAIEKRFDATTAAFFEQILHRAFSCVVATDPVSIPVLQRFSEVIVEDSSTVSLPDVLQQVWEGCGGKQKGAQAALKIHVRWDLCTGSLCNLALGAARQPDLKSPFKGNRRQRRSVRIADLGYFDTKDFEAENAQDEYWISRVKVGNLVIFDEVGNRLDLPSFLQQHAVDQNYECWVQVSATRRLRARLIAFPVPEEVAIKRQAGNARKAQKHSHRVNPTLQALTHWTLLITNIPEGELSAQEALILLRARWQIELLYKLWKQEGRIDTSSSANPWRQLCDVYAKLTAMILVHWMMIVGCWQIPNRSMVKAAKAIRKQANLIARALNGRDDLQSIIQEIVEGLDGCRQNTRHHHPSLSQLLLGVTSPGKTSSIQGVLPSQFP